MKITIINGISKGKHCKDAQVIHNAIEELSSNNEIDHYDITKLNIKPCTGCWTCWIKEPGKCIRNDDMTDIYKSMVKSDLLIFISEVQAGFIQSTIKMVIERMFALLLPYMTIVNNEFHHIPRYEKQPRLGMVIVGQENHDEEQEEIFKEYMYRLSLNFNKGSGHFLYYFNPSNDKEFLNEISNI